MNKQKAIQKQRRRRSNHVRNRLRGDKGTPRMCVIRTLKNVSCQLIDDETGKPVAGAVVSCGAVINDSRKGGGDRVTTDKEGRYRLLVPSPGLYTVLLKSVDDPTKTAAAV